MSEPGFIQACPIRDLSDPLSNQLSPRLTPITRRSSARMSEKCHIWPLTDGVRLCVSCAILHRLLRSTHVLCQRSDRWGRQWHPALVGMMPTTQVSVSTFFLPSATKLTSSYERLLLSVLVLMTVSRPFLLDNLEMTRRRFGMSPLVKIFETFETF